MPSTFTSRETGALNLTGLLLKFSMFDLEAPMTSASGIRSSTTDAITVADSTGAVLANYNSSSRFYRPRLNVVLEFVGLPPFTLTLETDRNNPQPHSGFKAAFLGMYSHQSLCHTDFPCEGKDRPHCRVLEDGAAGVGYCSARQKPPDRSVRVGAFCDTPATSLQYEKCQHILHAVERINDKTDGFLDELLPNHTLSISMLDTTSGVSTCGSGKVRDQFHQLDANLGGMVATIGPFCSDDVAAVTEAGWRTANGHSTVVVAPSSTAPRLSNVSAHPDLLRLSSNDVHVTRGFTALADRLGWRHVCVLHDDSLWGRGVMDAFSSTFESSGGEIINPDSAEFSENDFDNGNITGSMLLDRLKGRCRIVLLAAYGNAQRAVFAAAYEEDRLFGEGYAWLNAYPMEAAFYNSDGSVNSSAVRGSEGVLGMIESSGVSTSDVSSQYHSLWGNASSSQGCTSPGVSRPFCDHDDDPSTFPSYAAAYADAVIMLAASAHSALLDGASPDDAGALFAAMQALSNGTVEGISGPLVFDDAGDRLGMLDLVSYKITTGGSESGRRLSQSVLLTSSLLEFSRVGSYSAATSTLQLPNADALVFSGGTTVVPQHYSPPVPPPPASSPASSPPSSEGLLSAGEYVAVALAIAIPAIFLIYVRERRRRLRIEQKRERRQWLRYLSTGQPVQLEPLADGNVYHIFLSHAWVSGQDAMRILKERLLDMVPSDDLRVRVCQWGTPHRPRLTPPACVQVFLDVDDLQSGRGAAEVAMSKVVVIFLSDGYLSRPNTMRELLRAMTLDKLILGVFDEHSIYMEKHALKAAIDAACLSFPRWGLEVDLATWGAEVPSSADIFAALTARPLLWTRVPAFMDVTLRACATPLIRPTAAIDRRPSSENNTHFSRVLFENNVPISRVGISRSSKLSLSAEALERAVEGIQSAEEPAACSGLYTNTGISIDWKPIAGSQKFRIYASPQNPGALQLTEELSRLLQRLGIELEVTTSVEDVATCSHMLLYLDARTWAAVEGERRVEGLTDEVKAAMRRRVHLLLVHETEPFEYLEPDAAGRHAGVKFDDLLDSVDGATPIELLQRKVTGHTNALTHAAPKTHRSTSAPLAAPGLLGGGSAAQGRHLSACELAAPRARYERAAHQAQSKGGVLETRAERPALDGAGEQRPTQPSTAKPTWACEFRELSASA